jgi:hypothetical protein
MNVTRSFAIAATFAAVAAGGAAPAYAAPVMSGHYNATTTNAAGEAVVNDWYFTPCGDGCVDVSLASGPVGRAQLVNGQWSMDNTVAVRCTDHTVVPSASTSHFVWDPNTLVGTAQATQNKEACGNPPGTESMKFQLTKAP